MNQIKLDFLFNVLYNKRYKAILEELWQDMRRMRT